MNLHIGIRESRASLRWPRVYFDVACAFCLSVCSFGTAHRRNGKINPFREQIFRTIIRLRSSHDKRTHHHQTDVSIFSLFISLRSVAKTPFDSAGRLRFTAAT